MDQSPPRFPVICQIDGKTDKANYWIAGKILTVATGPGGKSRQAVSDTPHAVAEGFLKQLAREGKA